MGVRNPDIIRERLKDLHDISGLSFRKIARLDEYRGIPAGTLCAIAKGAEVPKKWRPRFGLFSEATVYVVTGGTVPPGAQVISANQCECGQFFISNHPARKKCFICSPFKRKGHP